MRPTGIPSPAKILLIDCQNGSPLAGEMRQILDSLPQSKFQVVEARLNDPFVARTDELSRTISSHQAEVALLVLSADQVKQAEADISSLRLCAESCALIVAAEIEEPEDLLSLIKFGINDFVTPPLHKCEMLPRIWRAVEYARRNRTVEHKIKQQLGLKNLIGESPAFREAVDKIPLIARCNPSVLIVGETGTGKELFARAIHYLSPRADKPFVPVNCGALPDELVENEMFGHEKGAFTDANHPQIGLIEMAGDGTLFLDEVDSLSLPAQVKLLRFLQEKEYRRLGSSKIRQANVRVIAATNSNPEEAVSSGRLRQDLYYRLNVVPLRLPPLRGRREDISLLARHFLARYAAEFSKGRMSLSDGAISLLANYDWPGNVRELENVIERAVVLTPGSILLGSDIDLPQKAWPASLSTFREAKACCVAQFERDYIQELLTIYSGNITKAARAANKNRRAFWQLIQKHSINPQIFRERLIKA